MGKDGSYIIPIIEKFNETGDKDYTRALVLTPEIEHARKVDEFVWAAGYHAGAQSTSIDMDGKRSTQKEALEGGVDIVIANPGRLQELIDGAPVSFDKIEFVVIDDAFKMQKMGLLEKLPPIVEKVNKNAQWLFYSDRLNDELKSFTEKYISDPEIFGFEDEYGVESKKTEAETQPARKDSGGGSEDSDSEPIEKKKDIPPPKLDEDLSQGYIFVPPRMKISTLMAHLDQSPDDNVLIFTASKRGTDRLFRVLRKRNQTVRSIHERLPKGERERRYNAFKTGEYQFLLITDISAKDIDFDHVKQVINYDVPNDVDEYRYRAGLVGSGKANRIVSLVSKQDRDDINEISKKIGTTPRELPLPEEVKKKAEKQRKSGSDNRGRAGKRKSNNRGERSRNKRSDQSGRHRSSKPSRRKKDTQKEGLSMPKPSYDKLEGGRSGKKKEESQKGVVGFFKKLFS